MNTSKYNLEQLYHDLTTGSERSVLYLTVKRAMIKQGRWKNKPRGSYATYGVVGSKLYQEQ